MIRFREPRPAIRHIESQRSRTLRCLRGPPPRSGKIINSTELMMPLPDSPRYHPGMDEKRKRMGALGWTVVALWLLLVAYPLSTGPAVYLLGRFDARGEPVPPAIETTIGIYLMPAQLVYDNGPDQIRTAWNWYAGLFID
jgi:hypothetical protein